MVTPKEGNGTKSLEMWAGVATNRKMFGLGPGGESGKKWGRERTKNGGNAKKRLTWNFEIIGQNTRKW